MCSIALHKHYEIYENDELFKYYWSFGEKNFIRERGDKSLSELREEQRLRWFKKVMKIREEKGKTFTVRDWRPIIE